MLRTPVLALAIGVFALPAMAATPESGTINDTTPSVEWTGGPYFVPNLTGGTEGDTGVEPQCVEGALDCDFFRFTVNLDSVNPDTDQITITVTWPDSIPDDANPLLRTPDYDVYLFDETCTTRITEAASADNPETMIIIPADSAEWQNKTYCVEIVPFAPMNESYSGGVKYEVIAPELSKSLFAGGFAYGTLLALAGLGAAARLRRRARNDLSL